MTPEALTLYKLIVLYMLNKVSFPLTNAQISEFIIEKEYTNYFTLQQVLSELLETGLARVKTTGSTSSYHITEQGAETLGFFSNRISEPIRQEIDSYLEEHKYELRSEAGILSDYYKSTSGNYIVHCQLKEDAEPLIELNLSVPDQKIAEHMCMKWKTLSEDIYAYIIGELQ